VRGEPVLLADGTPRRRDVDLRRSGLRATGRDGHPGQLAGARCAAVALAKLARRPVDHLSPARPTLGQRIRNPGYLEETSLPPGPPFQVNAEPAQLVRQLCAVPRAVDALRAKQLARVNSSEPAVLTLRSDDHNVRVQLRVGHPVALLVASQPRGGVDELCRDKTPRRLLAQRASLATAHHRHLALNSRERARDGFAVRDLDLRATVGIRHRPERRHRLRRAERHVHTCDARPVAADAADRLTGPR
jgi:hypothetical protein